MGSNTYHWRQAFANKEADCLMVYKVYAENCIDSAPNGVTLEDDQIKVD